MFRFVKLEDTEILLKIYAQYINTPVTFEYFLPTEPEFTQRITEISNKYPYLIYEDDSCILGYAYAHRYGERDAYQWNAELSVYISKGYTSKGLGRQFYSVLIEMLKLQGIKTIYAKVTIPNDKSENLHVSMGFNHLCNYHNTGFKCGKWHDVALFEKSILPYNNKPEPIVPISKIAKEKVSSILERY